MESCTHPTGICTLYPKPCSKLRTERYFYLNNKKVPPYDSNTSGLKQLCHYSSTQEQKSTIKEYFERNGIFKRFNEEFGDYQDCVFIKTPSGAFSMKLSHRSEQLTTTIVFWRVFSLRLKLIKLTLAYFKFQVTFLRLWLICWFEKNKIQRGRTQTETPFAIWRLEFEWIDWKFV